MDYFGFVETVDRFGECVAVAVANTSGGRFSARLGQALSVLDREVFASPIRVMDEATLSERLPLMRPVPRHRAQNPHALFG